MTRVLVLVDLQQDFLAAPGLEPAAGALVARAASLLEHWRERGEPVVHVWTTVDRRDDRRMPHWRDAGLWRCEAGTPGHATPDALRPRPGEPVVHKTDFSGFGGTVLQETLRALDAEAIVLSGTHLHACVQATALDAYRLRLGVTIAGDAVGSDDPIHAAAARRWLSRRGVAFAPVAALLAGEPPAGAADLRAVDAAAARARDAQPAWWATGAPARAAVLTRLADAVDAAGPHLATLIVQDVGKPVTQALEEVGRCAALLRAVAARGGEPAVTVCGPASVREERPLGVVALITPWNNPLAIGAGKLAPALVFGNTVVWKPSPAGTRVAQELLRLAGRVGLPPGVVELLVGDARTGAALMDHPGTDAVSLTGGAAAGWAAQLACARRGVPLQAELGGNNATLVASGADLDAAAAAVVAGAFDFAGQRCTAGRRVIVEEAVLPRFLATVRTLTAAVAWGSPDDPRTTVGPLIDAAARDRVEETIARAIAAGATRVTPAADRPDADALRAAGAYTPPVVLLSEDPAAEIVQEETFGPVLVVQPARDWDHAIALAEGVRHGLATAAYPADAEQEQRFLDRVTTGIVKIGTSTAGADVEAPFGGRRHSGSGPPEHGADNRTFYTRPRAVYRGAP